MANDTFMVTQSVLNGLVKFTGKYLQMMHLIPKISSFVWPKICELYDFYLCFVFFAFLTTDEKNKFMAKPNKMNLPAIDQLRDFEVNLCTQSLCAILAVCYCSLLTKLR